MATRAGTSVAWAIHLLDRVETVEEVWATLKGSTRAAVRADGATMVILEGDQCYYADEDAMAPLWKGQRFPVRSCISGWAMLHRQSAAIPDIRTDPRIPQAAYRPTFVRSLIMVPIMAGADVPVGAIGTYWARARQVPEHEIATLESLAEAAGRALHRISPIPRQTMVTG